MGVAARVWSVGGFFWTLAIAMRNIRSILLNRDQSSVQPGVSTYTTQVPTVSARGGPQMPIGPQDKNQAAGTYARTVVRITPARSRRPSPLDSRPPMRSMGFRRGGTGCAAKGDRLGRPDGPSQRPQVLHHPRRSSLATHEPNRQGSARAPATLVALSSRSGR